MNDPPPSARTPADHELVLAHQLRQPLGAVQSLLELIDLHAADPDRVRQLAARAHGQVVRALMTLQAVVETLRAPPSPRRVDAAALVRAAVATVGARLEELQELRLEGEQARQPVLVEPALIEIALVNLLGNAADAVAGHQERRVLVRVEREGDHVVIVVADTGAGILSTDHERIFDAGFTTKRGGAGMGLGLAIARGCAARAGAELGLLAQPPAPFRTAFRLRMTAAD